MTEETRQRLIENYRGIKKRATAELQAANGMLAKLERPERQQRVMDQRNAALAAEAPR